MRFDVVTLFPELVQAVGQSGVSGRALKRGLARLSCWNPRDFCTDAYRTIDDRPYGGGPGMVMMAPPLAATLDAVAASQRALAMSTHPADTSSSSATQARPGRVLLLSPAGRCFDQAMAERLLTESRVTLVCGRYEGVDQRLVDARIDQEVSLGDFVLSGGELGAMVIIDAVLRLIPGALNDAQSAVEESFTSGLLDHPHYTRPEVWQGVSIPPVLAGGHHAQIHQWRRQQALERTRQRRPDLLQAARDAQQLTPADLAYLDGVPAKSKAKRRAKSTLLPAATPPSAQQHPDSGR